MKRTTISRRNVLSAVAATGVVGVAGCLGGDDEDTYRMVLGGSSDGSSTFQAGQALARAADQHSDVLDISVQETAGWGAHLYEYDDGELSAFGVDNNSMSQAMNDEGDYEDNPVDGLPMQGFVHANLEIFWIAVEGSDIESTADLQDGGYDVHPIEPGFGSRVLTEDIMKTADIWDQNEIVNINASDVAGAVEEGRIDALAVYGTNQTNLAGWVEELDIRNEGELYLIEVDDNFFDAIEATPGAVHTEIEPYAWEQDLTTLIDTTDAWVLPGQWAFGPDVPADITYEIARLCHEHVDTIEESDPVTLDFSDPEVMTTAIMPEVDVHPGIAEFFEEHGVWDDEWTRGEAEE